MGLTVVSVAYPFARVDDDPVGGAEQVLAAIDRALVAAGHRSIVVAAEGSRAAGELAGVPAVRGDIDEVARARTHAAVRARIAEVLPHADLVHLHGIDFADYRPEPGPPAIVSLHLPLDWYPAEALRPRPGVHLVPVSHSQAAAAPPGVRLLEPVENGVDVDAFAPAAKDGFVLALGRVCPEKAFDVALDAARVAGAPMKLAGAVFPYPAHRRHFEDAIAPRLDRDRCWIGAVQGDRKRRLMAQARAVLVPSTAAETSSLVAREALAAGTPVIARPIGALREVVEPGVTGFFAETVAEFADAVRRADRIDPEACRRAARERFDLRRTTDAWLALYHRAAEEGRGRRLRAG